MGRFIGLLSSKLDSETNREWQKSLAGDELPIFQQFLEFLNHQCQILEKSQKKSDSSSKQLASRNQPGTKQKTSCHAVAKLKCHLCKGDHPLYQCKQFLSLSISQRIESARSQKICLNCLRSTAHIASKCPSGNCRVCSRKHNTLLHLQISNTDASNSPSSANQGSKSSETSVTASLPTVSAHSASFNSNQSIILSTVLALVQARNGSQKPARVLMDSGSQANFVTSQLVKELGLSPRSTNISISGIGGTITQSTKSVQIHLKSRLNSFSITMDCIVADRITDDLPSLNMRHSEFVIPSNIKLVDPKFNISSRVDVLIGAEMFWNLLCIGQLKSSDKHPLLQKTRFGWVLAGKLNNQSRFDPIRSLHASFSEVPNNELLQTFWKLEEFPSDNKNYTLQEVKCEEHFRSTVFRNSEDRYVVQLPFKAEVIGRLGNLRDIALKRLLSLERRLSRDPLLQIRYSAFMNEYISLGHMRLVHTPSAKDTLNFYLPHHCVVKEDAKRAKLRVIFDGSCKTDSGISLNDALMISSVVQENLISILIRFRMFRYAFVGDIAKMYRQVLVHPSQHSMQRILWRDNSESEVQEFDLCTVTYGTASASYQATRVLKDLADQHESEFPIGAYHAKRDFYVDDLLTGGDSIPEVLTIRDQITQLLKLGCFELSKWGSNNNELLRGLSSPADDSLSLDKGEDFRILGLTWNRESDIFKFTYNSSQPALPITKRSKLSDTSKLFDPLGLIGPTVVIVKIILQELWQSKVDWDESIPQAIHTRWVQLKAQLPRLHQFSITRCVKRGADRESIQIHGFCDTNQVAYGACVYIRTQCGPRNYSAHLLCSKSRVAPLKTISLPRLELSAVLLLSHLVVQVKQAIQVPHRPMVRFHDYSTLDSLSI